jgi:hypothetical protein
MPKNRIAVISVIKRIFKKSGFIQDFRMVRFLSENDKIENPELESGYRDQAHGPWYEPQIELVYIVFKSTTKLSL